MEHSYGKYCADQKNGLKATIQNALPERRTMVFFTKMFFFSFSRNAGMKEPVYDLEPFLTPNQKKRLKVKEIFANKYTNM